MALVEISEQGGITIKWESEIGHNGGVRKNFSHKKYRTFGIPALKRR